MKASEVICNLQELITKHGDCEVEYPYEIESSKGYYNPYGECEVQEISYEPKCNCFFIT